MITCYGENVIFHGVKTRAELKKLGMCLFRFVLILLVSMRCFYSASLAGSLCHNSPRNIRIRIWRWSNRFRVPYCLCRKENWIIKWNKVYDINETIKKIMATIFISKNHHSRIFYKIVLNQCLVVKRGFLQTPKHTWIVSCQCVKYF